MRRLTAVLATALLLAGGCTAPPAAGQVSVLATWTGEEERAFLAGLDVFERETGIKVDYRGTRALGQVLKAEVAGGRPPDVAVLPGFGDLLPYIRDKLVSPLQTVPELAERDGPQWDRLSRGGLPHLYAVPVKKDLKGLVWSRPRPPGEPAPTAEGLLAAGDWCLGLGSPTTSGWPGTDWVENLLLQRAGPAVYQRWVAGDLPWTSPQVRQAWVDFGRIAGPRGSAALLTDFADAGRGMFDAEPGCRREHQASFIAAGYQTKRPDGRTPAYRADFDYQPFPAFSGAQPASPVAADLAARFTANPAAERLIRFLAGRQALQPGPPELDNRLRERLLGQDTLCFDGSDLMPVELRTMFYRAVLEYVADRDKLAELLNRLEQVRRTLQDDQDRRYDWVTVSCGR
ncbi:MULTISPECIES: extracellular solute-binding protein [unclassified Crossiella]|uniref:extracellular solute-binding protein n=1 Tax=unclassified Crossiella TaxID=2620835 RepID=UPI0020003816|nr:MULTISPECIES: extracellular solute-binding protein [unclassified Crossiella]MCK2237301.1 extracellular solute-binding protein [Crossiella sp. S99.2]MCK2250956.1 extracellular solute-binding protein [Crossiella sp. S99.1]